MPITPHVDKWLHEAGYEYHCFVSWPHTNNKDMTECAIKIKETIEAYLACSIPNPKVFLDESDIIGGAIWQKKLKNALCKSISMVAVCAPIYYHPSHKWCGQEWAAMNKLSKKRLPQIDFHTIIPLLLKKDNVLPIALSEIQYIDFSRVLLRGRNYYRTIDFRNKIWQIVGRIEQIACTIAQNQAIPDCAQFNFPNKSAFGDIEHPNQPFPFRD